MADERVERALSQRLFLVDLQDVDVNGFWRFMVLGSTELVYKLTFRRLWSCSCPDFSRRRLPCKHIYFVLNRVLGLDRDLLLHHHALGTGLVADLCRGAVAAAAGLASDSLAPALAPAAVAQRPIDKDDSCAICFESIDGHPGEDPGADAEKDALSFCSQSCGKSVHTACFLKWVSVKGKTCVYCRAEMFPRRSRKRALSLVMKI